MSNLNSYHLNSSVSVVELDLLEISHTSFTQTYRIVRNAVEGITLPDGTFWQYYPAVIEILQENNLDYGLKVSLGDLGEILPKEIKVLRAAENLQEKPIVSHYVYRSDDLTTPIAQNENLLMADFSFDRENSYFVAGTEQLNNRKTGKTYNFEQFPMMESFL